MHGKMKFVDLLLSCAACVYCGVSSAQEYPAKPVQIVIPFAPGGSIDITFRVIGPGLSERFGQQVLVVNRPGGAATIGMAEVARAAPDGYTLGAASFAFAANPSFMAGKMPFDTEKDLVPVTQVAKSAMVMLVNPTVPARSINELVALAKTKPGVLNYGSVGIASSGHLATELFTSLSATRMIHVPYNRGPLPGLVANEIQVQLSPIPSAMPFIKSGKVIALGVSSPNPDPTLPDVPPISASVPGFDVSEWPGLVAPAGTPVPVINRIRADVVRVLANAEVRKRLADLGSEPVGSTPEEFGKHIKKELSIWSKVAAEVLASSPNKQ